MRLTTASPTPVPSNCVVLLATFDARTMRMTPPITPPVTCVSGCRKMDVMTRRALAGTSGISERYIAQLECESVLPLDPLPPQLQRVGRSLCVGDRETDLELAGNIGVRGCLVRAGDGYEHSWPGIADRLASFTAISAPSFDLNWLLCETLAYLQSSTVAAKAWKTAISSVHGDDRSSSSSERASASRLRPVVASTSWR